MDDKVLNYVAISLLRSECERYKKEKDAYTKLPIPELTDKDSKRFLKLCNIHFEEFDIINNVDFVALKTFIKKTIGGIISPPDSYNEAFMNWEDAKEHIKNIKDMPQGTPEMTDLITIMDKKGLPKFEITPVGPIKEGEPLKLILEFIADSDMINKLKTVNKGFNKHLTDRDVQYIDGKNEFELNTYTGYIHMDLSNCDIQDEYLLSHKFSNNLVHLDLSYNDISDIPELPLTVEHINISNNSLFRIQELHKLKRLHTLNISSNNISDTLPYLPDSIKVLFIDKNSLSAIQNLPTSLEEFSMSDNYILEIPKNIYKCNNLKFIEADNNSLKTFPDFKNKEMKYLQYINLNNNYINNIPDISNLNRLAKLLCGNNSLERIYNLPQTIQYLDVTRNRLNKLTKMPNIKCLYISNNRFTDVKEEWLSKKLHTFNCFRNLIKSLPKRLPQSLMRFNCAFNRLEYIGDLSYLFRLRQIDFSNNNLYEIPNLPVNIEVVKGTHNPFKEEAKKRFKPPPAIGKVEIDLGFSPIESDIF